MPPPHADNLEDQLGRFIFFPLIAPRQVEFYGKPAAKSENELVWQLENKLDFICVCFRSASAHLCAGAARFVGRWQV